jgi:hypothetical protein
MQILNFVIALIFMFLLFSLFTSWILEFITQQFNLKGKFFQKKLEAVFNDSDTDWLKKVFNNPLLTSITRHGRAPSQVEPELFAKAVTDVATSYKGDASEKGGLPTLLKAMGENITPEETKQVLLNWFDAFNKRVKFWYKEFTRKYLFFIGLALAIIFNVDMVEIAQTLWKYPKVSENMAFTAEEFLKNHNADDPEAQAAAKSILFDYQQSKLLPIGWPKIKEGFFCISKDTNFALKFLGFILSAFVVTLGAPFWFEALQKVLSLRGGKK